MVVVDGEHEASVGCFGFFQVDLVRNESESRHMTADDLVDEKRTSHWRCFVVQNVREISDVSLLRRVGNAEFTSASLLGEEVEGFLRCGADAGIQKIACHHGARSTFATFTMNDSHIIGRSLHPTVHGNNALEQHDQRWVVVIRKSELKDVAPELGVVVAELRKVENHIGVRVVVL